MKHLNEKFFFYTLGISILIHGLLIHFTLSTPPEIVKKQPQKIRVTLQSPHSHVKKQIVESALSTQEKKPAPKSFLGKKTQSFTKETVSKRVGSFRLPRKGGPTKSGKKKKERKKKIALGDLSIQPKHSFFPGHLHGVHDSPGPSQSNDFVEHIPLGELTQLNTVQYKYYGFFNRIKKRLEKYWGLSLRRKAEKLWKTGHRFPARESRMTGLVVTLDDKGNIVDIVLKGTSGIQELDDAAVESFNSAGPFPNPPRGMIKNGITKFEWGFIIKS